MTCRLYVQVDYFRFGEHPGTLLVISHTAASEPRGEAPRVPGLLLHFSALDRGKFSDTQLTDISWLAASSGPGYRSLPLSSATSNSSTGEGPCVSSTSRRSRHKSRELPAQGS